MLNAGNIHLGLDEAEYGNGWCSFSSFKDSLCSGTESGKRLQPPVPKTLERWHTNTKGNNLQTNCTHRQQGYRVRVVVWFTILCSEKRWCCNHPRLPVTELLEDARPEKENAVPGAFHNFPRILLLLSQLVLNMLLANSIQPVNTEYM